MIVSLSGLRHSLALDLMACCSRRTFARELAHLGCCPSKQVSPSYPADVVGSRVLLAGILHSGKAPVLRVMEAYHQSPDLPVRSFLHVNKFAPASVVRPSRVSKLCTNTISHPIFSSSV